MEELETWQELGRREMEVAHLLSCCVRIRRVSLGSGVGRWCRVGRRGKRALRNSTMQGSSLYMSVNINTIPVIVSITQLVFKLVRGPNETSAYYPTSRRGHHTSTVSAQSSELRTAMLLEMVFGLHHSVRQYLLPDSGAPLQSRRDQ
jgi:hypothetical protein